MTQTRLGRWLTRWFPYRAFDGGVPHARQKGFRFLPPMAGKCRSLHRWTLIQRPWLKVYLHCWEGSDWSKDFHDHSARMVSIGLRGAFDDVTPTGTTRYAAPFLRTFPATHLHRVELVRGPAWTLVVTGRKTHHSAFVFDGKRLAFEAYAESRRAEQMKAC